MALSKFTVHLLSCIHILKVFRRDLVGEIVNATKELQPHLYTGVRVSLSSNRVALILASSSTILFRSGSVLPSPNMDTLVAATICTTEEEQKER